MDRITKSLMSDFLKEQSIKSIDDPKDFEKFCNYSIISNECSDTFDIQDISVGGESDTGFDGIAILINGRLIDSVEEVDDIVQLNGYLDANFVFIQSKTSSSFDGSDIGDFFYAIGDFFSKTPKLIRNEFVIRKAVITEHILQMSSKMIRRSPIIKLCFVTTGKWMNDANLVARIDGEKNDLENTNLFSEIIFHPIDASSIQKLYRSTKENSIAEINFPNRVTLPDLDDVSQSYLGTIPISEYLKLITDESGNIQKSLFYDNIRDFQGDNEVNKEMAETLKGASTKSRKFVILNNGITVVAKGITLIGNRMTLRDYQVVNGCQTSHVIYNLRDEIDLTIHVPIRIIATIDEGTTNIVIKSTNRQTEVKTEELAAMSEFQKKLETFYTTFDESKRLYYERRSKQYTGTTGMDKSRIITIPTQIRVFASMFLDLPYRTVRYYGTLKQMIGNNIFAENHDTHPYYTSAFAYIRGEYLLKNGQIDPKYRRFRYHTLMILRYQLGGIKAPFFNSGKMSSYCNNILADLWSDNYLESFEKAIQVIDDLNLTTADDNELKTQVFTERIIDHLKRV